MSQEARILVVDDEENIRSSLQEMLSYDGYQVVAVDSGEAAIQLIATEEQFDLALIDLKLNGIDGIDVLATLRRLSPNTVVIMLTAYASLETAVEALRHGAHDYLFKPCKPAELRESIEKGLQNRQPELRQQALLHQLDHLADNLADLRAQIVEQQPDVSSSSVSTATTTDDDDQQPRFLRRGALVVDSLRYDITLNGQLLDLSHTEFSLLTYLIDQAPRVVSPQELTREVKKYDDDAWGASEAVRQNIYRIRQKIKEINNDIDIIRTVRGVGYTIDI